MDRTSGVILAVDSDPPLETLAALQPHVDGVKLGLPLLLDRGPDHLAAVADIFDGDGQGVVCDFKLADIPPINRRSVEAAMDLGATHVICHAFVGPDSVEAAVQASGGNCFVVAEMSHPGGARFFADLSERFVDVAREAGALGLIAPATRPKRVAHLRGLAGVDLKIATPGVGTQGGSAGEVFDAGADWIIVGRSILHADDPVQAAESFSLDQP